MTKQAQHLYEFGPFRIDSAERLLLRDGHPVPLTTKAFDTLLVLVEKRGHLVDKNEMMSAVWPDSFVEEGNLAVTISMIRKALGDEGSERRFIQTVSKCGYRFVADVRVVAPQSETPSPVVTAAALRPISPLAQTETGGEQDRMMVPFERVAVVAGKG